MKKVLTLGFAVILSVTTFGQIDLSDTTVFNTTTKVDVTPYVAAGISVTNTSNFKSASYMSAEVGVMIENFTVAGVFGVNNLNSFNSGINGYWYEGKVAYSFPLGFVDGYGVFGVGSYIGSTGSVFIEYGGGIMKSFGNVGAFLQVSSWDGITYMTPGLSYSF
jgi:hypothetical protein